MCIRDRPTPPRDGERPPGRGPVYPDVGARLRAGPGMGPRPRVERCGPGHRCGRCFRGELWDGAPSWSPAVGDPRGPSDARGARDPAADQPLSLTKALVHRVSSGPTLMTPDATPPTSVLARRRVFLSFARFAGDTRGAVSRPWLDHPNTLPSPTSSSSVASAISTCLLYTS